MGCHWVPTEQHSPPAAGDVPLPAAPRGPAARHRGPTASCTTWAGSRYRSFDGRHFGFQGECAYSLAASTDSTWAVSITTGSVPVPTAPGGMRRCQGGWVTPWIIALEQRGCPHCCPLTWFLLTAAVPQVLHVTFGLDTVVARGLNISVNGVAVPEGQPHLHGGEG